MITTLTLLTALLFAPLAARFRRAAAGGVLLLVVSPEGYGAPPSSAPQIKLGPLVMIYDAPQTPIRYDGSLSPLRRDGNMHFFHSFGCRDNKISSHTWHKGTISNLFEIKMSDRKEREIWNYDGFYGNLPVKGIWILGTYKCPNGDLLGITNAELNSLKESDTQTYDANLRYALGLGYSTDNGLSWTYCGEIVRPGDDRCNIGGGAYIIRDEYIYVYFNDTQTYTGKWDGSRVQCVARAKLADVLDAASRHKVTVWQKYRDGKWDTSGLSGKAGSDIIPNITGREDMHVHATYCTALRKYLMTVHAQGKRKLFLFSSPDGLQWSKEVTLDDADQHCLQAYSTFVDFGGPSDDCHTVDGDFYITWPRLGSGGQHRSAVYQRRITIESAPLSLRQADSVPGPGRKGRIREK